MSRRRIRHCKLEYNFLYVCTVQVPHLSFRTYTDILIYQASWVQNGGSFGHDLVSPDDLVAEQVGMSRSVRSTEDMTEPTTEENPLNEDENSDLFGYSDLETRARDWFLRCDRGERTLAQCTQQFDTYCDEAGRLHSDDVICRFDCSVSTSCPLTRSTLSANNWVLLAYRSTEEPV